MFCRCECPGLIRLLQTEDNGWYIAEQWESHNHSLLPNFGETIHWPSHKHIYVYRRDLIKHLRQNNVNLAKVYSTVGSFFGSMENVPFTKRSLRNLCGTIGREHSDDDVRKTTEVFAEIGAKDLISHAEFRLTKRAGSRTLCGVLSWLECLCVMEPSRVLNEFSLNF